MIEHLIISETLHKSGNPNQSVVLFVLCLSFSLCVWLGGAR